VFACSTQKCLRFSAVLEKDFTKFNNYIGAGNGPIAASLAAAENPAERVWQGLAGFGPLQVHWMEI
jgi:hypothetical protein